MRIPQLLKTYRKLTLQALLACIPIEGSLDLHSLFPLHCPHLGGGLFRPKSERTALDIVTKGGADLAPRYNAKTCEAYAGMEAGSAPVRHGRTWEYEDDHAELLDVRCVIGCSIASVRSFQ